LVNSASQAYPLLLTSTHIYTLEGR
jgi:hypothetical protein